MESPSSQQGTGEQQSQLIILKQLTEKTIAFLAPSETKRENMAQQRAQREILESRRDMLSARLTELKAEVTSNKRAIDAEVGTAIIYDKELAEKKKELLATKQDTEHPELAVIKVKLQEILGMNEQEVSLEELLLLTINRVREIKMCMGIVITP